MIPARLLEDCAHNLRIVYSLPVRVDPDFLRAAGANRISVNRFSQFVAGARDHVTATFSLDPPVRVEAIVGAMETTCTFGSLHGAARPETVARVEQLLDKACTASLERSSGEGDV